VVSDRAAEGCPRNPAGFWPGSSGSIKSFVFTTQQAVLLYVQRNLLWNAVGPTFPALPLCIAQRSKLYELHSRQLAIEQKVATPCAIDKNTFERDRPANEGLAG